MWKDGKIDKNMTYDIFNKYGTENCKIHLLENAEVQNKDELEARESFFMRTMKCVNKVIPNRTRREYGKEYRKQNELKISHEQKQYRQQNRDCTMKQIKIKHLNITQVTIKQIKHQFIKQVSCSCGCQIAKCNLNKHMKTTKLQN
jgi:hypothetical protein